MGEERVRLKWELEKALNFGSIEIEKEMLQLARGTEDLRKMLGDASLLYEQAKRCLWGRIRRSMNVGSMMQRERQWH